VIDTASGKYLNGKDSDLEHDMMKVILKQDL
jgi:hypothetical protein